MAYKYLGHYGSGISCQYGAFSRRYVKNELYKKFESLKKVLIPKPEYVLFINELKHFNEQSSAKSHQGYYILSKYDILQCGDVEKLIRCRKSNDDPKQYYVHIEETFDVILNVPILLLATVVAIK